MMYKFNNKEYRKGGHNQTGLGSLVYDIFKYYLENNRNKTYKEIQDIFNPLHKQYSGNNSNKKVVFNKNDFNEWHEKAFSDTKRNTRYFEPPIKYNNEELYFTTQWGNANEEDGNIINFIDFARKDFGYNIQDLNENNKKVKMSMKTKNIMLYGAPGVGKTHNYKRLITMIENGNDEKTIFDTISKNETTNDFDNSIFEDIKKEKRIEFVTFHQSYSYEDFIEGFRPNEDGNIELDKKGGIFKRISDKAKENLIDSKKEAIEIKQENDLLISFENYTEYKILNDEPVFLKKGDEFKFTKFENKRLYFQTTEKSNYFKEFTLFYDDFKIIYNSKLPKKTLKDISIILNTNSVQQRYAYLLAIYNDYKEKEKSISVSNELEQKIEQKNFYIVIDEINRGNISKIFGELITLIEEDKRDTYEVTLPYSKEKFKIPSNLYIIATMNSTDKSIATIDIALRRRFTFLKMKPKEELVKNEKAKDLMKKLNGHISNTINQDYQLGHSYFMKIVDDNNLEFVKKYKIQPLLEEYFYGDEENYKKAISILNIEEDNQ